MHSMSDNQRENSYRQEVVQKYKLIQHKHFYPTKYAQVNWVGISSPILLQPELFHVVLTFVQYASVFCRLEEIQL